MDSRDYWLQRVKQQLAARNVLWLKGVRRVGKTTLVNTLPDVEVFDCELPRVRERLEDPERFFRGFRKGTCIALDEVHRLLNPSEALKIAADHFPALSVIATGSSTLDAKRKFRDTLTGRKADLWLAPVLARELSGFLPTFNAEQRYERRFLHGGLPGFLLSEGLNDGAYLEWMDSFWAKDVQELFVIEKKRAFTTFIELLFRQSGELFQATNFTSACELSRQTIMNYLDVLETTLLASVVRPFTGRSASELRSQPKVYAFDTGFVCWLKGIETLSPESKGLLLEHLTLETLQATFQRGTVHYWRNKAKNEVDFVVKPSRGPAVHAIECKAKATKFDSSGIQAFRRLHPEGRNIVVSLDATEPETRVLDGLEVTLCRVEDLHTVLVPQV